jgi:methylmalonyl-CoA mutase
MARNLPIILERECGLTQVIDPLAGSHAVETLTAELAALTWQSLADMGDTDAWRASLSNGHWQAQLAETHTQRVARITEEKQVMVGVNRYLAHTESAPAGVNTDSIASTSTDKGPAGRQPTPTPRLLPVRDAETFEMSQSTSHGDAA